MKFLEKFNLKPLNILKSAGLVILAIIILAFAFKLIGSSFSPILERTGLNRGGLKNIAVSYDSYVEGGSSAYGGVSDGMELSVRNVQSRYPSPAPPYEPGTSSGSDAEEFEVTEYSAFIKARNVSSVCDTISNLKVREDVIFENANQHDQGCFYTFKVVHGSVEDVLAVIKNLDPRELSENTYTIKKRIEDFTSELEILEDKLGVINETLNSAILAYDSITRLATQTRDVESLAKIIDSKINIIERLTTQKVNVSAQIERLARAKDNQLDRLDYTYFNVSVVEDRFVDAQALKDSWKNSVKSFVRDINTVAQDITVNLVVIILWILQYVLYALILVVVIKYGLQIAKGIWKK